VPTNDQSINYDSAHNSAHNSDRTGEQQEPDDELQPTGPDPYLAFALRWWWLIVLKWAE
jgi:hypothetical protein